MPTATATAASMKRRKANRTSPGPPNSASVIPQKTSPNGISEAAQASQSVCTRAMPDERRRRSLIAIAPANSEPSTPSQNGTQIHSSECGKITCAIGLRTFSSGRSNGERSKSATVMKPRKQKAPIPAA